MDKTQPTIDETETITVNKRFIRKLIADRKAYKKQLEEKDKEMIRWKLRFNMNVGTQMRALYDRAELAEKDLDDAKVKVAQLTLDFEAEVNTITKLYEESKTARHNLSREFFKKEKKFQQRLTLVEKDNSRGWNVAKDAKDKLAKAKDTLNELIKYAEMGIAENDDALIESPVSMYRYTLKQLLIAKKAQEGETCQNIEHRHPCYRNEYCPECGISTCSPNYAYHVCVSTSYTDLIKRGECPNGCGKLTALKHPLKIVLLIPEDLIEYIPEEADEDYYGAIRALCLECSFTLTIGGKDDESETVKHK